MRVNPCLYCQRVEDPHTCDDKTCKLWQAWFLEKWSEMRYNLRLEQERRPKEMEGENIGGRRYALPHRVHSYLGTDPCEGCCCPRDLCRLPCRVKRDWIQARKDVLI